MESAEAPVIQERELTVAETTKVAMDRALGLPKDQISDGRDSPPPFSFRCLGLVAFSLLIEHHRF